jgi:hypothetical protein
MKGEEQPTANDDIICPLTLRNLPTDPLDIAYIWSDLNAFYNSQSSSVTKRIGCGHKCTLQALLQYVQHPANQQQVGTILCPVCCTCPILAICDGVIRAENDDDDDDIYKCKEKKNSSFQFRYGKQVYRLAVVQHDFLPSSYVSFIFNVIKNKLTPTDTTVQGRICQVLQLDEKTLKVSLFVCLFCSLFSFLLLLTEQNYFFVTIDLKERKNYIS